MSLTSSLASSVEDCRRTSPGLRPYRRAAARSSSTSMLRQVLREARMRVDHAVDLADLLRDLLGLVAQVLEVGAEDAHDDRLARPGENLLDALAQVGLHVAVEARVPLDRPVNGRQRVVVVDVLVDADPVLAEVDAVDLVAHQRLADVRAAVAHAGDLAQVLAGPHRDARLLRRGRARLGQPVHQEVALLEVRQQLVAERRVDQQPGQQAHERPSGSPGSACG